MSCYNWEEGTIKIPARQFKDFANKVLLAAKSYIDQGHQKIISFDDGCITLDYKTHCVCWDVPENNRASEHARDELVARALFRALEQIKWVRGSGGTIVGNDEYNRDSRGVGGGGNYEVAYYGPPRKTKTSRRFR
jgi:hypothetical protein